MRNGNRGFTPELTRAGNPAAGEGGGERRGGDFDPYEFESGVNGVAHVVDRGTLELRSSLRTAEQGALEDIRNLGDRCIGAK